MEELEQECIIGGNGKVEEMEVGTQKVHGKQVMYMRDDKTEGQITCTAENQKGRYAIGYVCQTCLNSVLFGRSRRDTKQRVSLSLQESAAMQVHAGALVCGRM